MDRFGGRNKGIVLNHRFALSVKKSLPSGRPGLPVRLAHSPLAGGTSLTRPGCGSRLRPIRCPPMWACLCPVMRIRHFRVADSVLAIRQRPHRWGVPEGGSVAGRRRRKRADRRFAAAEKFNVNEHTHKRQRILFFAIEFQQMISMQAQI